MELKEGEPDFWKLAVEPVTLLCCDVIMTEEQYFIQVSEELIKINVPVIIYYSDIL